MSGIKINTNIPAMMALRKLGEHQDALAKLSERLSSGMRITHASDDAAGLSISASLSADRRIYSQAIRNANDGISMLSLYDSALSALSDVVKRQQELAEQAANGSLTNPQRLAAHQEAYALTEEFNRIIESTTFNGMNLLNGAPTSNSLQLGVGIENSFELNLRDNFTRNVGSGSFQLTTSVAVGYTPNLVKTADINNDGFADIISGNQNGSTVSVVLGNGDGTFQSALNFLVGEQASSLVIEDMNKDGNLDILTTDYGVAGLGTTVSLLLGNGDGTFQARRTIPAGLGPVALAVADMDNDGTMDIVSGSASINFVSGNPEYTYVGTPSSGLMEITDITFSAIATREATTITTPAVGTDIQTGDYFYLDSPTTSYYVWYRVNGAGSDPSIAGKTGLRVDVLSTDTGSQVATKLASAIDGLADFVASPSSNTVNVTNVNGGAVADAVDVTVGGAFSTNVTTQGTNSIINNGSYFTFDTPSNSYYVWFNIGGTGVNPGAPGTGIQINLNWGDSANTVATAVANAINPLLDVNASPTGSTVRISETVYGDAQTGAGTITGLPINTVQIGEAANLNSGQHFYLNSVNTAYYVWYNVDGAGGNPLVAGRTGVQVNINKGWTAAQVTTATANAIDALGDMGATAYPGYVLTYADTPGLVPDPVNINVGNGFWVGIYGQGTEPRVNPITDTVTTPLHGLTTGQRVRLASNSYLPAGLPYGTDLYVIVVDPDTLKFATSLSNAMSGTAINITDYGYGIHSISIPGESTGAAIARGNGDGTFQANEEYQLADSPNAFWTADLNGDGNSDLVSVGVSGTVQIALGDGAGHITPFASYTVGTDPRSMTLADFNSDGILDIATGNYGTSNSSILFGNGNGTFDNAGNVTTGTNPSSIIAVDVNNDGINDLITADSAAGLGTTGSVLLGRSDGTFSNASTYTAGAGVRAVASADFNGDGVADLAVANWTDSTVSILNGGVEEVTTAAYLNLRSQTTARAALTDLAATAERIVNARASAGATLSALSTHVNLLQSHNLELAQAESRITDVDMAQTMAEYIRRQILSDAATAVLANANQTSALALKLLKF